MIKKPTITVVAGDEGSGRMLVATAVALHVVETYGKAAKVIQHHDSERMLEEVSSGRMPLDDVLLVSTSAGREPWMDPWFALLGGPLFEIGIARNEK